MLREPFSWFGLGYFLHFLQGNIKRQISVNLGSNPIRSAIQSRLRRPSPHPICLSSSYQNLRLLLPPLQGPQPERLRPKSRAATAIFSDGPRRGSVCRVGRRYWAACCRNMVSVLRGRNGGFQRESEALLLPAQRHGFPELIHRPGRRDFSLDDGLLDIRC